MINRYYAGDVKVKPNSDKDIKVIREEDFIKILSILKVELDNLRPIYCVEEVDIDKNYLIDEIKEEIKELFEIKDCFGEEE